MKQTIENQGLGRATGNNCLLENKCAVVFGAGGSIGAAVAKEFAAEGARVFLAGRTKTGLEAVASQIAAAGGEAQTAVVDAVDDAAVNRHLDGVTKQTGKIDIVVDLTGPLQRVRQRNASLTTIMKSHFITRPPRRATHDQPEIRRNHFR